MGTQGPVSCIPRVSPPGSESRGGEARGKRSPYLNLALTRNQDATRLDKRVWELGSVPMSCSLGIA